MGMMSIALLAATLVPGVELGGRWLDAAAAAKEGLVVSERVADGVRRVTLENRSGRSVFPSELGWRKSEPWHDGFVGPHAWHGCRGDFDRRGLGTLRCGTDRFLNVFIRHP